MQLTGKCPLPSWYVWQYLLLKFYIKEVYSGYRINLFCSRIFRNKTMEDKLIYIPNDDNKIAPSVEKNY